MERITLRVPATSANLGPGFDSFGCALALYNTYTFERIAEGIEVTGCPPEFCNAENLSIQAYRYALDAMGLPMEALRLHVQSEIPVCRGLGSSSAMIIGGVFAANAMHGAPFTREEMLALCTVIEGHPDNLAPALYGGMTASLMRNGRPVTACFPLSPRLRFLALVPDFPLSTEVARAVLPQPGALCRRGVQRIPCGPAAAGAGGCGYGHDRPGVGRPAASAISEGTDPRL